MGKLVFGAVKKQDSLRPRFVWKFFIEKKINVVVPRHKEIPIGTLREFCLSRLTEEELI